jgi:hypothetical protein
MKSERELIHEISRIGRESRSLHEAVDLARALLDLEVGSSTLLVDSAQDGISPQAAKRVSDFLNSREFPFRGLYTARVLVGNSEAGRLIACFDSFGFPGGLLERLTGHIAQQLGQLIARTQDALPRMEAA